MANTVTKPYTFAAGGVAFSAQVNSDFDTLYNWLNGTVVQTNVVWSLSSGADASTPLTLTPNSSTQSAPILTIGALNPTGTSNSGLFRMSASNGGAAKNNAIFVDNLGNWRFDAGGSAGFTFTAASGQSMNFSTVAGVIFQVAGGGSINMSSSFTSIAIGDANGNLINMTSTAFTLSTNFTNNLTLQAGNGKDVLVTTSGGGQLRPTKVGQQSGGQWATRLQLSAGTVTWTFPVPYTSAPIVSATTEGTNLLHVSATASQAFITSASGADTAFVHIIAIGNPN